MASLVAGETLSNVCEEMSPRIVKPSSSVIQLPDRAVLGMWQVTHRPSWSLPAGFAYTSGARFMETSTRSNVRCLTCSCVDELISIALVPVEASVSTISGVTEEKSP